MVGNIVPQVLYNLYDAVRKEQGVEAALEECHKVEKIEEFAPGWMPAIKTAITALGIPAGIALLPYAKATEVHIEAITEYLRCQGFLRDFL